MSTQAGLSPLSGFTCHFVSLLYTGSFTVVVHDALSAVCGTQAVSL